MDIMKSSVLEVQSLKHNLFCNHTAFGSLDLSTHQHEFGEILGVDDTDIETSGNSSDDQIDLSHISYDDDTGKPDSQTGGGYASPDKIKLVEEVSVEVVLSLAHEWFPGEAITEMASNNPGYDLSLIHISEPTRRS